MWKNFSAKPPGSILAVGFEHVGSNYCIDTTFACGLAYCDHRIGTWWSVTLLKKPVFTDYEADPDDLPRIGRNIALNGLLWKAFNHGLPQDKFVSEIKRYVDKAIEQAGGIKNLTVIAYMHADLARLGQLLSRPIDCLLNERKIPLVIVDLYRGILRNPDIEPSEMEIIIWRNLQNTGNIILPAFDGDPGNNVMRTAIVYWHLAMELSRPGASYLVDALDQ
jgi:hypothetical protein